MYFYFSNQVVICKLIRKIFGYIKKVIFPLNFKKLDLYWLNYNITAF